MIDWTSLSCPVSKYFSVSECLYLPQWNRIATEADGLNDTIKNNLIKLCIKLDVVRDFFNRPMMVHSMYRPQAYNDLIGGAKGSAHIEGLACDFHISEMICDEARGLILPHLEEWGMRMEDLPGAGWCHLDLREPGPGGRFFKP